MFRAHVLNIRWSKLHYTASGIITPIGGCLVHKTEMHGQQNVKVIQGVSGGIVNMLGGGSMDYCE